MTGCRQTVVEHSFFILVILVRRLFGGLAHFRHFRHFYRVSANGTEGVQYRTIVRKLSPRQGW